MRPRGSCDPPPPKPRELLKQITVEPRHRGGLHHDQRDRPGSQARRRHRQRVRERRRRHAHREGGRGAQPHDRTRQGPARRAAPPSTSPDGTALPAAAAAACAARRAGQQRRDHRACRRRGPGPTAEPAAHDDPVDHRRPDARGRRGAPRRERRPADPHARGARGVHRAAAAQRDPLRGFGPQSAATPQIDGGVPHAARGADVLQHRPPIVQHRDHERRPAGRQDDGRDAARARGRAGGQARDPRRRRPAPPAGERPDRDRAVGRRPRRPARRRLGPVAGARGVPDGPGDRRRAPAGPARGPAAAQPVGAVELAQHARAARDPRGAVGPRDRRQRRRTGRQRRAARCSQPRRASCSSRAWTRARATRCAGCSASS